MTTWNTLRSFFSILSFRSVIPLNKLSSISCCVSLCFSIFRFDHPISGCSNKNGSLVNMIKPIFTFVTLLRWPRETRKKKRNWKSVNAHLFVFDNINEYVHRTTFRTADRFWDVVKYESILSEHESTGACFSQSWILPHTLFKSNLLERWRNKSKFIL